MLMRRRAFSLVEVLVVIGIIALLLGMLMPSLRKARQAAVDIQCASQLRQIGAAFYAYMNDHRGMMFWRGEDINVDGMDWYAYGGQESGNLHVGQGGLFNRFQPRVLNPYVGGKIDLFRCPMDNIPNPWSSGLTLFEWVGNSYQFNATGCPYKPGPDKGLAGVNVVQVKETSRRMLFLDGSMGRGGDWHGWGKGNVCFVDGHVSMIPMPREPVGVDYTW